MRTRRPVAPFPSVPQRNLNVRCNSRRKPATRKRFKRFRHLFIICWMDFSTPRATSGFWYVIQLDWTYHNRLNHLLPLTPLQFGLNARIVRVYIVNVWYNDGYFKRGRKSPSFWAPLPQVQEPSLFFRALPWPLLRVSLLRQMLSKPFPLQQPFLSLT